MEKLRSDLESLNTRVFKLQGAFFNFSPLNLAKLLLGLGLSQNQGGEVKKSTLYIQTSKLSKFFLEKSWWKGKATSYRDLPAVTLVPLGSHDVTRHLHASNWITFPCHHLNHLTSRVFGFISIKGHHSTT